MFTSHFLSFRTAMAVVGGEETERLGYLDDDDVEEEFDIFLFGI